MNAALKKNSTERNVLMAFQRISEHFKNAPYMRVFLARSEADEFVKRYVEQLDGRVVYDFEFPRLNARVIVIESPFGNLSAECTDTFDALPDYAKKTRVMYMCDDVNETLKTARDAGLNVVQDFSPTPGGTQGRFELAPGYVVEVITLSPSGQR
jgi:hypothetical protein